MNKYQEIENQLGLHFEISIIYVVDGYQAFLYHETKGLIKEGERGETIEIALENLEKALSDVQTL